LILLRSFPFLSFQQFPFHCGAVRSVKQFEYSIKIRVVTFFFAIISVNSKIMKIPSCFDRFLKFGNRIDTKLAESEKSSEMKQFRIVLPFRLTLRGFLIHEKCQTATLGNGSNRGFACRCTGPR